MKPECASAKVGWREAEACYVGGPPKGGSERERADRDEARGRSPAERAGAFSAHSHPACQRSPEELTHFRSYRIDLPRTSENADYFGLGAGPPFGESLSATAP